MSAKNLSFAEKIFYKLFKHNRLGKMQHLQKLFVSSQQNVWRAKKKYRKMSHGRREETNRAINLEKATNLEQVLLFFDFAERILRWGGAFLRKVW